MISKISSVGSWSERLTALLISPQALLSAYPAVALYGKTVLQNYMPSLRVHLLPVCGLIMDHFKLTKMIFVNRPALPSALTA